MSKFSTMKSTIVSVGNTSLGGADVSGDNAVLILKPGPGRKAQVVSVLVGHISAAGAGAIDTYVTLWLKKSYATTPTPIIRNMKVTVGEGVQCLVGGDDRLFLESNDELLVDSISDTHKVSVTVSYILEG